MTGGTDERAPFAEQLAAEPGLDESCQEAAAHSFGELVGLMEPALLETRVLAPTLAALKSEATGAHARLQGAR